MLERIKLVLPLILGLILWLIPSPEGLDPRGWKLFAIFISTIFSVIINAFPIITASIFALAISILTGVLSPSEAYSGFSKGFILLIVVAFLVARGVVKSGLGKRIAFLIIKKFGKSTLGLAYSMTATDMLIAPAFPSNTARSGVLFPIIQSLAQDSGSKVSDGTRSKIGSFLMMNAILGLSLSSTLWLTAMAANPTGVVMAKEYGINISFFDWFLAASVPTFCAYIIVPFILYKIFPPEIKYTPNAPKIAEAALNKMGPVSRNEWIMGITFIVMVVLWSISSTFNIDKTAIAFLGLTVLMVSKIFTIEDFKGEGSALSTFIWFAILYTLSSFLNKYGFMNFIGEGLASYVTAFSWPMVYMFLISLYVLIHYFFVSQTAQMLALYGVFLGVGIQANVPPKLLALMLLFATNFNSAITPQGSSANVLFAGSGYLTSQEIYKFGGIATLLFTLIYLTLGTAWIILIS